MYVRIFIFSFNQRETRWDRKLVLEEASRSIMISPKIANQTCRRELRERRREEKEGGREGGRGGKG
jgi:hypothetical protein